MGSGGGEPYKGLDGDLYYKKAGRAYRQVCVAHLFFLSVFFCLPLCVAYIFVDGDLYYKKAGRA